MDGPMKKEQYFHLRRKELDSEGEERIASHGGATICYLPGDEKNGVPFTVGVSICSPADNFCKSEGRAKARGNAVRNSRIPNPYRKSYATADEVFKIGKGKIDQKVSEIMIRKGTKLGERHQKEHDDLSTQEKGMLSLYSPKPVPQKA